VRDGIESSMTIGDIEFVPIDETRKVLVIHIPKSFRSPHRVVFGIDPETKGRFFARKEIPKKDLGKNTDQFYARNSAGKYPLDVSQLREAFTLSETLFEKARNFRIQKIMEIKAGNTPIQLSQEGKGKIVLHIIPLESFSPNFTIDLESVNQNSLKTIYKKCYEYIGYPSFDEHRRTFEGFLSFGGDCSYTQLHRNGIIEATYSKLVRISDKYKFVSSLFYEKTILEILIDEGWSRCPFRITLYSPVLISKS
jgi:hypothetical protein